MILEEAIKHCEEVAKEKCDACGAEHKQLAEWLRELKWRRNAMNWMAQNVRDIFDMWMKSNKLIEKTEKEGGTDDERE